MSSSDEAEEFVSTHSSSKSKKSLKSKKSKEKRKPQPTSTIGALKSRRGKFSRI